MEGEDIYFLRLFDCQTSLCVKMPLSLKYVLIHIISLVDLKVVIKSLYSLETFAIKFGFGDSEISTVKENMNHSWAENNPATMLSGFSH